MAVKKGLGKGIDNFFGESSETNTKPAAKKETKNEGDVSRETLKLNINNIEPNRTQPRKKFDDDRLQELADSIKQYGIVEPIVVQKKGKMYEIIAGERRWRAARMAGLKEVPVVISDYAAADIFAIALIENIQREDLNPIEEALAYQRLINESHLKQDEVAERVSKNRTTITNSLRLLKLCPEVQEMVIDDLISGGHARALISIEDPVQQLAVAQKILDEQLTVRDTEKLVKALLNKRNRTGKKELDNEAIYKGYEDNIRTILGNKVEIKRNGDNKGKLVISFSSAEDFERIYSIINKGGKAK